MVLASAMFRFWPLISTSIILSYPDNKKAATPGVRPIHRPTTDAAWCDTESNVIDASLRWHYPGQVPRVATTGTQHQ
jgi:hypothetical protein